tara:strand:- start:641 stop:1672 length:1032 start_codon:yes stop_codon:yes gene_type:complete
MAAATIGGAAIGAVGAGQTARAQERAAREAQAGFRQYEPYVDANLLGASGALDNVLNTGAYQGGSYAGPNAFQTGTANIMGNLSGGMIGNGSNMLASNANFGNNSQGLYNQFQGMSTDAQNDRLSTANSYAANNSDALVNSAMRDDMRNLNENTLTGINLDASNTGNTNSSRAGVATAVANRAYDDRRADVAVGIQDRLVDRSLAQQAQQFSDQGNALSSAGTANDGISSAYNMGLNTVGEGANFGMNAGNTLQGYSQNELEDARRRFEGNRDFEMDQRTLYQSGILGQAPDSKKANAVTASPLGGAMSGGMAGFGFAKKYMPQKETSPYAPKTSSRPFSRTF